VKCIVTAGPTYEPLDEVRRLTNFSTGKLGSELANFLVARGHEVTLLLGSCAVYSGQQRAQRIIEFTTTDDLRTRLRHLASANVHAVLHAAAVSDFGFGRVFQRVERNRLRLMRSGKFSTGSGTLLAELVPTPKILRNLRGWFSTAWLAGWKYEVEGDQGDAVAAGVKQLCECKTDVCVVNGPAYGTGFGVLAHDQVHRPAQPRTSANSAQCSHVKDAAALFELLEERLAGAAGIRRKAR
jgi:phosphopantothenoylcysteine decarboxylase/phosphopantothenate--cysteine ligase